MRKRNKASQLILKAVVSVSLIGYVSFQLRKVSLPLLIAKTNWLLLFVSLLLFLIRNLFGAFRWQQLLKVKNYQVNLLSLLKYYFIGNFFGFFLPTSVGGDIARIYFINRETVSLEDSISSVLAERVIGVFAIIVFFFIAIFFGLEEVASTSLVWVVLAFLIVLSLGIWLGVKIDWNWLKKIKFIPEKFITKIIQIINSLKEYQKSPKALILSILISLAFQGLVIYYNYLLALSIDVHISLSYFMLFIPLIWIVSLIPISLNGFGLREGSFVYLFSLVGMSQESGSIISMINILVLVIQGLIGWIIFILERVDPDEIVHLGKNGQTKDVGETAN